MTDLFIKIFIPNQEDVKNLEVRGKYAMLSTVTGIILNILLSIGKMVVGILANCIGWF